MEQIPSVAAARSSRATTLTPGGDKARRGSVGIECVGGGHKGRQRAENLVEEGVQPVVGMQGADLP